MTSTLGGGALAQRVNTITDCKANRKAHLKKIDGKFNIIKQAYSLQNIRTIQFFCVTIYIRNIIQNSSLTLMPNNFILIYLC